MNCTILIAAVSETVSIDMCENTNIVVAAPFVRIGNCVDCVLHCYVNLCGPVIYGDSRALVMAPHNCSYNGIVEHLSDAKIIFSAEQAGVV